MKSSTSRRFRGGSAFPGYGYSDREGGSVVNTLAKPWRSRQEIPDPAFDVSPADLQTPVEVILIDGDGNKHQQTVDLSGILDIGH
jgi:hypothetical protein